MNYQILIVEDEIAIAETLVYACKSAHMQAHHCLLGQAAIDFTQKMAIDFIILDVGLPDISGFEVCRQIRQYSSVPILFLTAQNHEIDRIVGLEIGADDYVTKPFSPREIVARIHAILRRTEQTQTGMALKSSQFLVDETAGRIRFFSQHLNLTRYEYLLLKTLVAQPKRIYSRAQLMDIVWQDAPDSLDRTVDAHIKTLRAKLREIKPDAVAIVTHRGMGYSLET